jgi:bacterioferritin-associated ferredoxin
MIVCLCRGINDRQLRQEAILAGGDVSRVMESTGAGTVCGSCCQEVQDLCSGSCATCPSQSQIDQLPIQIGAAA